MTQNKYRILAILVLTCLVTLTGCMPDVPDNCGENVKKVENIDFRGPNVIPDNPGFAGYDVTITIQKEVEGESATVCFAVRDEDPWYKFFWAVDDVLDSGLFLFPGDQTTRTNEGVFVLRNEGGEICGTGAWHPDFAGCSDEKEAEVYLQVIEPGSTGPDSPIHKIELQ